MCKEVAPKNYLNVVTSIKRRKIKPKGRESERKSRRVVRDDIVAEEIPKPMSQSLRSLILKGGHGDQKIRAGCNLQGKDWDYFPNKKEKNFN